MIALLLAASAWATTGLAFQWGETELRYSLKAQVNLANWMYLKAERNAEGRITDFRVEAYATCKRKEALGKRAFEVTCALTDLELDVVPVAADRGRLKAIVDEWDARLLSATVVFIHGTDGRLKDLHLEGIDTGALRERETLEAIRLILVRAFAPLDLQLPKKGDDRGHPWRQGRVLAMEFPSALGTVGAVKLEHTVEPREGSQVVVQSEGRGVVGPGATYATAGGEERLADTFDMTLQGSAVFDTARGVLLEREYLVEAAPTASSMQATTGQGTPYVQAVRVELLAPDAKPPPLGTNDEVEP